MGSDLSVVNAARRSYDQESTILDNSDVRLLNLLSERGHGSPFRHAVLSFEIKAPLMIARQWWRYIVGSDHTLNGWNEKSRRYVADDLEFYIPADLPEGTKTDLERFYDDCIARFEDLRTAGVPPEKARIVLPANALYTTWIWTASLQAVNHFLDERLDSAAQQEMQQYAQAVYVLTAERFPHACGK
jgi:thymidylate synthase (FAD)